MLQQCKKMSETFLRSVTELHQQWVFAVPLSYDNYVQTVYMLITETKSSEQYHASKNSRKFTSTYDVLRKSNM